MSFDVRDYLMRKAVIASDVYNTLVSDPGLTDYQKFQLLYAVGVPLLGTSGYTPQIETHRILLVEVINSAWDVMARYLWWIDDSGVLLKLS
jgi:hypothetical protein